MKQECSLALKEEYERLNTELKQHPEFTSAEDPALKEIYKQHSQNIREIRSLFASEYTSH